MKKKALISGITGQDGSYLAELLLNKDYDVYGIKRRSSSFNTERIDHIIDKITILYGDVTDALSIDHIMFIVKPDEIYHLGAQSHVKISFEVPGYTAQTDAIGTLNMLEAMRKHAPNAKFYNACHDDKTKIITEKGIVNYTDLKEDDLVYSFNVNTEKIELTSIKKIHVYDYDGNMISIQNKRISKLVTPNHRIFLKTDNNEYVYEKAENIKSQLKYSNNSHFSLVKPKKCIPSQKNRNIDLSKIIPLGRKSKNHTKNLIYNMYSNDLLYLIGLYIGDGFCKNDRKSLTKTMYDENLNIRDDEGKFKELESSFQFKKTYSSSYIQFALPKTDKSRPKLLKTLDKYNIEYKCHEDTVDFSSWMLSRIFKTCGEGVYNKQIPNWVFDFLDEDLSFLVDGLMDSDGHIRIKDKRMSYSTTSDKLLKDIIVLFVRLGYFCSVFYRSKKSTYFKSEKRNINSKGGYIINVGKRDTNKIYKNNITEKKYIGKVWCLEVNKNSNFLVLRDGKISFCGNSTSELFGLAQETPQKETTPFYPRSPYAIAKLYAYWIVKNYRESYGLFAVNGILFNHESERRGSTFVTKKITEGLAKYIENGTPFYLGNLNAKRDWGYSPDFVEGMWRMLQQETPEDFVLATGETHTIKEFIDECILHLPVQNWDFKTYIGSPRKNNPRFQWKWDENERSILWDTHEDRLVIGIDEKYYRPAEVDKLLGDPSKAKEKLGWEAKTKFKELVKKMMKNELKQ